MKLTCAVLTTLAIVGLLGAVSDANPAPFVGGEGPWEMCAQAGSGLDVLCNNSPYCYSQGDHCNYCAVRTPENGQKKMCIESDTQTECLVGGGASHYCGTFYGGYCVSGECHAGSYGSVCTPVSDDCHN